MAWVILEEVWDLDACKRLSCIKHSTRFSAPEPARDEACRLSLGEGPDSVFLVLEEDSTDEPALHKYCQGAEL